MSANIATLSTAVPADEERLEILEEFLDVSLLDGEGNPVILAEREVTNGSGRVVGTEYDISADTLAEIDTVIEMRSPRDDN